MRFLDKDGGANEEETRISPSPAAPLRKTPQQYCCNIYVAKTNPELDCSLVTPTQILIREEHQKSIKNFLDTTTTHGLARKRLLNVQKSEENQSFADF